MNAEAMASLQQIIVQTIDGNSKMINESIKSLEDKMETKLAAIEKKVDNNFLLLTDANSKLKEFVEKQVERIDGEMVEIVNKNNDTSKIVSNFESKFKNLHERYTELERSTYSGQQHSRKYNLEIDGFPVEIVDDDLKDAAVSLFNAINAHVIHDDIEVIHRLPANKFSGAKATIVRFHSRAIVDEILENKKKLKSLDNRFFCDFLDGVNNDTKFYIRPSLFLLQEPSLQLSVVKEK